MLVPTFLERQGGLLLFAAAEEKAVSAGVSVVLVRELEAMETNCSKQLLHCDKVAEKYPYKNITFMACIACDSFMTKLKRSYERLMPKTRKP